jgi:transposase InsO family protein
MVLGELLQHPPTVRGERRDRLRRLAEEIWTHPQTGEPLRLGFSTISRWYDRARRASDPVAALVRQARSDRGACRAVDDAFAAALRAQHAAHPEWTAQLLYDNAVAAYRQGNGDGRVPSYPTIRRHMRAQGMQRRRRLDRSGTARAAAAERRFVCREVERFECTHVGALVHWDFHVGSVAVCDPQRGRFQPRLLAFLDDRSRLVLHAQWYAEETARVAVHGFMQACAKHGLPRAVMSDNGAAMRAAEVREGFDRLGVAHRFTQVYSPYQNGKMECFWGSVEGRLLAMARADAALDLARLNRLTAAWLHEEYQRRAHATTGDAPLARFAAGPAVLRPAWSWERMVQAFTMRVERKVRRTVGTVCVEGCDFDLPPAWRHLERAVLRIARWDLSRAWLCHPRSGEVCIALLPADPQARSDGRRRRRAGPGVGEEDPTSPASPTATGLPPLLRDMLARFEAGGASTGMVSDTVHDQVDDDQADEEAASCTL